MKLIKRVFLASALFLITTCLFGFQLSVSADILPSSPDHFYLDQSGILDNATKNLVDKKGEVYKEKPEAPQVVLAVINSTDGDSIDSYAPDLFQKWQIGNQKEDNGVLILYAVNDGERNVRIEVGYGLEDVITDSTAGNILQHAKEDLKSDNDASINQGLQYTFNAVTTLIDKYYDYPADENALSDDDLQDVASDDNVDFFAILFIIIIVLAAILGRGGRGGRGGGPWYWGGYGSGSSGSSGGFGGGFSGGGGSSGGGGASI